MSNEMFNMVKAVVGVGVLSLPAGEWALHDLPVVCVVAVAAFYCPSPLCRTGSIRIMPMIYERTPDCTENTRTQKCVRSHPTCCASNYTR